MNYLKQILAFHNWLDTNQLDPAEQALWFHLMEINNKCGWTEWFTVANMTLQARLGVDRKTLDRKRNTLISKGRIHYKNQGKRQAGKYNIIPVPNSFAGNIPVETGLSVPNDVPKVSLEMSTLNKQNKTKQKNKKEIYCAVIDHLNAKAGTNYKSTTKSTQEHINGRLGDGFTVDDFKAVIDKKVAEWKGTEFEQYLRPQTLFAGKFESYLNQGGAINGPTNQSNRNLGSYNQQIRGPDAGKENPFPGYDRSKFEFPG